MTQQIMHLNSRTFGKDAQDKRADALQAEQDGALAALESFYHSFNTQSLEVFDAVWADDALIQLNNPLGGIQRGLKLIRNLYERIYTGPADVWVEFSDIAVFCDENTAVFAGRETGEFNLNGITVPLSIRTTRVFQYLGEQLGWRQVHHHGSIDDAMLLQLYQDTVNDHERDVTTVTRIKVKLDQVKEFKTLTADLVKGSRTEEGILVFDFYPSLEMENEFLFHKIFKSREALAKHSGYEHTQKWLENATRLLEGKPIIHNMVDIE